MAALTSAGTVSSASTDSTDNASSARSSASAVNMLTVYIVLLLVVPSGLILGPLGSLGKPAFLWGLVLAFWWVLHQLQLVSPPSRRVWQPVRYLFLIFMVIVLVSFSSALLRGQPSDQVSPAFTAVLRAVSWGGVLFVAMDGVRTADATGALLRRLTITAGLIAAFGLAQFLTGNTLLGWMSGLPGLNFDAAGVQSRGAFTRAAATATHPLEYAVVVTGCLPIALVTAISDGFGSGDRRFRLRWWLPVLLMATSSLLSVSRSGIIGVAVAVIATLPAMPRPYRRAAMVSAPIGVLGVAVLVPGMFSTMRALFTGSADDPSAQSRNQALARLPEFVRPSPVIGQGFGTFLPRYYIFDNEWALLAVEVGILGAVAFLGVALAGIGSSLLVGRRSADPDLIMISRATAAAILTVAVLFTFFDALSFPMSGGMYVLFAGLAAALRGISATAREASDLGNRS